MAATLTRAMLDDLRKGNASFKVVPQTYNITDTTFDDADQFFTVEDTLAIGGGDVTINGIKIDQSTANISEYEEFADVTISGSIPSTALEVFDYLFEKSNTQPTLTSGITASDGITKLTEASGYKLNGKGKAVTILIESDSKDTAIIYTNVKLFAGALNASNVKSTPWAIPFNGLAKEATVDGAPSFIVLKAA